MVKTAPLIIGALLGITGGLLFNFLGPEHPLYSPALYVAQLLGKGIFVSLLKMMIIPLVFTSITLGIANLRAHTQMGRVWKLTVFYFISTSLAAILLGLVVMNVFKPGVGLTIEQFHSQMSGFQLRQQSPADFTRTIISNLFLNPFKAMANGEILPTIVFALFLGIALVVIAEEKSRRVIALFEDFFELIMIIIAWIMKLLPVGLCALLLDLFATQNMAILKAMGSFIVVVIGATLFHGFVVLPILFKIFSGRRLKDLYRSVKEALITALATSSSSATLPVTMRCVEENLRVNKDVAGFVLPLGATVNMDGTAIYEAMAALFVANLCGVELGLGQQLLVMLMAMVASVGAPGIPSAGMVTMMMVLQSVGLPPEAVAILIPFDRPLDALRTMVNVKGDIVGSAIVDRWTAPLARSTK